MFSKLKTRKTVLILLLVALFSLIPTNTFRVLADGDIVPPFPYDELQTIGENDYVLFKVHGVEQVDYVEVVCPDISAPGAFDDLCPGLSYSSLGGWVLQLNSIDYYFKNGEKVYFDLQSLSTTSFVAIDNDDPYFSFWLEFVYCTSDIWGMDEDAISGHGIKFFKAQNFMIEPAATPTPTPVPDVPFPDEMPDVDDLFLMCKAVCNYGGNLFDTHLNPRDYVFVYTSEPTNATLWRETSNDIYGIGVNRNTYGGNLYFYQFDNETDELSFLGQIASFSGYNSGGQIYSAGLSFIESGFTGITVLNTCNKEFIGWGTTRNFAQKPYFFVYWSNGNITSGENPNDSQITPTSAPTPIPQPSETPENDDSDSGWGWGIVNTLKYIFIPDKNKLIRLEKTTQTRFQQFGGGYDDLKHVSGFEDPVRPQNVIMNWQPFGTDSEEEQQHITLVDFEQIDFYLFQTSSGMFICECLKASFTFLMFGYLIHVIRKHFVIENTDDDKGGGD